ncbi:hypothetical protein BG015_003196, partial [Linnemannia schmuckeri]
MNFIVKHPMTACKFDAIIIFVDKLSKQVHLYQIGPQILLSMLPTFSSTTSSASM